MNKNSKFSIVLQKKKRKTRNEIEVSKAIIYHINERSEAPCDGINFNSLFIHETRKSK
jgi:hypothetical protein